MRNNKVTKKPVILSVSDRSFAFAQDDIMPWVVLLGSVFAMGFALYAQYFGGYHPCELCMWQRYGYVAVIILCLVPQLRALVPLALAAIVIIAIYHTGIEQKWWEGFQSCAGGLKSGQSLADLRNKIMSTPAVRCDEATWFFLSLSMATWNAIYAFLLFVLSLLPIVMPSHDGRK